MLNEIWDSALLGYRISLEKQGRTQNTTRRLNDKTGKSTTQEFLKMSWERAHRIAKSENPQNSLRALSAFPVAVASSIAEWYLVLAQKEPAVRRFIEQNAHFSHDDGYGDIRVGLTKATPQTR